MSETPDIERPHRSRGGCFFLVLPVVLIPTVIGGYTLMFGLGVAGRAPTGDRVQMDFEGCIEAREVVVSRVEHMGLGDPTAATTDGGFSVTAQMPDDARVAGMIPESLTEVGDMELYYGAGRTDPLASQADVVDAFPRMTTDASATSVIKLVPEVGIAIQKRQMEEPSGFIELYIDDKLVMTVQNAAPIVDNELDIEPEPELAREAIERAASRAIAVADPLPCAISLRSTSVIAP
ncbi:MAG: hypothetical protein KC912_08330 [Proteobacteria bacterium]|nr:hypothetical protein [Pseudomonadota bacterium]